jgi:23S rRNA (uracil1939-C5)-methyltransferase
MQLTVEKLVYGGDGLARVEQADGKRKTVFVPLVLPGERVEATIAEERPGFARAKLDRVLEPSAARTAPPCPYFGECGGCHYQHATYEEQLRVKQEILRETVARIAKIELPDIEVHAAEPLHYRNRTRVKTAIVAGGSTKFAIGYYKMGSHELLPVKECPISSPLINRALQALWEMAVVRDLPKGVGEIELFADDADEKLLMELLVSPDSQQTVTGIFAEEIQSAISEVAGVAAVPLARNREEAVAAPELNGSSEQKGFALAGRNYVDYRVGALSYQVSAGAFFQGNRHLTGKLLELVTQGAGGKLAMDLYAGVGLFALALAENFERVVAVEAAPASFGDLKRNAPRNAKAVQLTTEAFLEHTHQKADFVVVDPPRAGLGKHVVHGLTKLRPKALAYVSCDPSTLARDLPGLAAAGYRIREAHLVDLFPQTFHIETVLRMER